MIGYLQGKPVFNKNSVIILTGGVGYQVEVGSKTRSLLNENETSLFIYTHVREDKLELFGFLSSQQKELFELLLSVSGIGPKTALEITDRDPEMIISAVQNAEVSFFSSIPRIGKKLAQKIILELKSKLGSLKELSLGPRSSQEHDIFATLEALGYEETEIASTVGELQLDDLSLEESVKLVLKKIAR